MLDAFDLYTIEPRLILHGSFEKSGGSGKYKKIMLRSVGIFFFIGLTRFRAERMASASSIRSKPHIATGGL
jgi:hypothetical protein